MDRCYSACARRTPTGASYTAPMAAHATEQVVVSYIIEGLRNHQIAERLRGSQSTVETHLGHIYEKLGVHKRNQVLARFWAQTYGLIISAGPAPDQG